MASQLTKQEIEQLPWAYMVYRRVFKGTDGKRKWIWLVVTDLENEGQPMPSTARTWTTGGKANFASARPGNMYRIRYDATDDVVYPGYCEFVEMWKNVDDVCRWQAENDAQATAWNAEGAKRKANQESVPFRQLRPFHTAYMNLPTAERPYLLAKIIGWVIQGE